MSKLTDELKLIYERLPWPGMVGMSDPDFRQAADELPAPKGTRLPLLFGIPVVVRDYVPKDQIWLQHYDSEQQIVVTDKIINVG